MAYEEVLRKSFYQSYETKTDLWSYDDGLTNVALKLVNELASTPKQHRLRPRSREW